MKKLSSKKNLTKFVSDSDLIKFEHLSYVYNPKSPYEFQALDDVNVTIDTREIIGIIGSTGSGKSTFVQHLNGLLTPSSGTLHTHGYTISEKTKKIRNVKGLRRRVGLVFQFPEYQLFEETVRKDIMFGPIQLGVNKATAALSAEKYIKLVGLPQSCKDRSPFALSGGQKRRVAVAGILAMEGGTLILDEPTAGLDPQGERDFINLFLKLNKKDNKRIIWVSHNMDHMLEVCDRLLVFHKGKILAFDTPAKIFSDHELMHTLNIQPPQVYQLMYNLEKAGFGFAGSNISNLDELVEAVNQQLGEKK